MHSLDWSHASNPSTSSGLNVFKKFPTGTRPSLANSRSQSAPIRLGVEWKRRIKKARVGKGKERMEMETKSKHVTYMSKLMLNFVAY